MVSWVRWCVVVGLVGGCGGDTPGDSGLSQDTDGAPAGGTDPPTGGGDTEDTDDTDDSDTGTVPEPPQGLSHAVDIQPIWDQWCGSAGGCHLGIFERGDLDLDDGLDAVGTPSSDVPGMNLIEPKDPGGSYLWHKLQGTQFDVGGTGSKMPLNAILSPRDLAWIEAWILQGAAP